MKHDDECGMTEQERQQYRDEKAFWLIFLRSRKFFLNLRQKYIEEHGEDFPPDMLALYEEQLRCLDLIQLRLFQMKHVLEVIE